MPDQSPPQFLDAEGNPVPDKVGYRNMAVSAAQSAGLDPDFVGRLVDAESGGNPHAVSPKGAQGLMQVLPATAKQYGVLNLMDPAENIKAGISYLKDLTAKYPNRPDLVAAAYNAGPGAVDKAGGVPPFKETQDYVQKVAPTGDVPEFLDINGNPVQPKQAASGSPKTDKKGTTIFSNKPQTWVNKYPNVAAVARGVVNTLPAVGAMVGGIAAAPETFGAGAVLGGALGAGIGKGARDLVAESAGLEPPTSPIEKAAGIATDTAIAGATPGAIEALKTPIKTLAEFADVYRKFLPRAIQPQFLEDLPQMIQKMSGGPKPTGPVLVRPGWQAAAAAEQASAQPATAAAAPAIAAQASPAMSSAIADNVKLTSAEVTQGLKWKAEGVPQDVILKRIMDSRALTKAFGLPSPDEVRASVSLRNLTGDWK